MTRTRLLLGLSLVFSGAIAGIALAPHAVVAKEAAPRDGVFIHLTAGPDQPHRVLMALRMATMMAEDRDVVVYADIEGVKVLRKGAELRAMPPLPSLKESLAALQKKKVTVYACPGCMGVLKVAKGELLPWVKVAEKEGFFNFTRGRILTLDY
jgi:intracellular sulfur oxidation DsrE/DsrF family protein